MKTSSANGTAIQMALHPAALGEVLARVRHIAVVRTREQARQAFIMSVNAGSEDEY